ESAIVLAWQKLHAEDLYSVVFHENPSMTLAQFVGFFSQSNVAVQLCLDLTEETNPQLAGMVWLADITDLPSHRRATGSFVFFRDYQSPRWTSKFAEMTLEYWFTELGIDYLLGVTPRLNRAARLFAVRHLQSTYAATVPGYTSYGGQACDALLITLTKEKYMDRRNSLGVQLQM